MGDVSIQAAHGAAVERLGEARQRTFDKADTNGDGTLSLSEFTAALQARQSGTNGSANGAAPTISNSRAATLFNTLDVSGTGQLTVQELNRAAREHGGGHHGRHHGCGTGGLLGGDAMGALLGGQESAGEPTAEAGQSGLLASIGNAVERAIGSYFGAQPARGAAKVTA
jgi:EF hand